MIDTCPLPRAAAEIGSIVECELSTRTLMKGSAVARACHFRSKSMHEVKPRAAVKQSISSSLDTNGAALPMQAEGHTSEPACERGRLYYQRARCGREVSARFLLGSVDSDASSPATYAYRRGSAAHLICRQTSGRALLILPEN